MKMLVKLMVSIAAPIAGIGVAHAQAAPPSGAPAGPGLMREELSVRNPGDSTERDAMRARDEALDARRKREKEAKAARAVPAKPEQVTVGSEVRDSKGVVIARVESVSPGFAVVASDGGRIEVPLEAFGMGGKGLMFGMPKAEFDTMVAQANKPAG